MDRLRLVCVTRFVCQTSAENVFERKRLRREKIKRIWTDGSRPAFFVQFVSHWKTKSNFAPFFLFAERETVCVCVFNYIRLAGLARLVSPKLNLLTYVHIQHYPNLIKLDCWPCAGPRLKKNKNKNVWGNSKSIRAEYREGKTRRAAIRFDPA